METIKRSMVVLAVAFTLAGTAHLALADCGICGTEAKHDHKKDACVRCEHEKACQDAENCTDPAHSAECTCPDKQKEE